MHRCRPVSMHAVYVPLIHPHILIMLYSGEYMRMFNCCYEVIVKLVIIVEIPDAIRLWK